MPENNDYTLKMSQVAVIVLREIEVYKLTLPHHIGPPSLELPRTSLFYNNLNTHSKHIHNV
jgi:hypothetical protein